jgi:hypothetical protein
MPGSGAGGHGFDIPGTRSEAKRGEGRLREVNVGGEVAAGARPRVHGAAASAAWAHDMRGREPSPRPRWAVRRRGSTILSPARRNGGAAAAGPGACCAAPWWRAPIASSAGAGSAAAAATLPTG